MASRYKNITIDQGTDFSMTVNAYASQDSTTTISNLTPASEIPYRVDGQIRKSYYHTTNVASFVGSIAGDGSTAPRQVNVQLTRDNTSSLSPGRYVYDIELFVPPNSRQGQAPGNTVIRLVEGTATVTPEVTR